ncbi:GvpL/GvpF family gas vesicle protein [Kitasatospora sp. A2-31]|uniref:GvpL/GvpF family gas vesicle protein n=1 Tax=Kitasatospora sp. A2-31 TaxID=2916414 RepID=UPI001EEA2878|nr:GvpL/GvpF family gas vesicle protein [Kitasatospora sp. A2-31]MCG6494198.1 GvpL/GvpF family gas vesicle protein [Kitasatospora sp. A2-31]
MIPTPSTDATWLYAVAPGDVAVPTGLTGVAGEPPHTVTVPGLAAVVGAVPRADFDEEPLRARLGDASWLESAVLRHHHVVEVLSSTSPALPARFATLHRDDRRTAAVLREHRDELLGALRRIAGRAEWGVKAHLGTTEAPEEPAVGGADQERPGTAYLLRRRDRRRTREAELQRGYEDAEVVHRVLAASADGAVSHPPQPAEASAGRGPALLNGAYLVDRERQAAFEAALEDCAERFPGLRLELSGPWPPYSFAGPPGAWSRP